MRIVCLSDTHHLFSPLSVPEGDLLLHAGDLTEQGRPEELIAVAAWLRQLPHRHKVVIAGNHDRGLERPQGRDLLSGLTYLQDQSVTLDGLRLYGSPWTPEFGTGWAFQAQRGSDCARRWANIPDSVDILLTHGPPAGRGDRTIQNVSAGCQQLRERVDQIRPLLHLFGHIHEAYGIERHGETWFANASNAALGYRYLQPPLVFDWDGQRLQPLDQPQPADPLWNHLCQRLGTPRPIPAALWPATAAQPGLLWVVAGVGEWLRFETVGTSLRPPTGASGTDCLLLDVGAPLPSWWLRVLQRNRWRTLEELPLGSAETRERESDGRPRP